MNFLSRIPRLKSLIYTPIRTKTYVKKPSKTQKKLMRRYDEMKLQGIPIPPAPKHVLENKFWKVVGNMKIYKPVSPGTRNRRQPTRFHLHPGSAIKRLSFGKRSTGGRNHTGKITIRHRGGGHKRRVRIIDFHRNITGPHQVVRLEYDPNRTANLALLRNQSSNEFSYIIRPADLNIDDIVYSWRAGLPPGIENTMSRNMILQNGNCLALKDIPVGTTIHSISLKKDGPAKFCRSAGTSAQLVSKTEDGYAQIQMGSKEIRLVSLEACATIGVVGNEAHKLTNWGKAGAKRRKGIRPTVRGIAMNAVDHPHGGGKKCKGGKTPRSPWGQRKGVPTTSRKRWYLVTPRWKAKMISRK